MKEDYENELAELEIRSIKEGLDREKDSEEHTKVNRVIDILSCKQEIVRRNIEACMNVLRIERIDKHGNEYISQETRTQAENKIKEMLGKLEAPQ